MDQEIQKVKEIIQGKSEAEIDNIFAEAKKLALAPALEVWKTIKSGLFKNADEVRGTYRVQNVNIGDCADDILNKIIFSDGEEREYDLGIFTTTELTGKKEGGTTVEVFAGAKRLGLEKITGDLVTTLRSIYIDQPKDEWLLMGMEPTTGSGGRLRVLGVGRDDGGNLWLSAYYASSGICWSGERRWVFVLPRK